MSAVPLARPPATCPACGAEGGAWLGPLYVPAEEWVDEQIQWVCTRCTYPYRELTPTAARDKQRRDDRWWRRLWR